MAASIPGAGIEAKEPDEFDEWNPMDPSLSSPVVAWLASDKASHVTGQVIRAVRDEIVHMVPWSNGNTVSKPGQALGGVRAERGDEHRHLPLARTGPALLSPAREAADMPDPAGANPTNGSTVADLLGRCLEALGATRVFGSSASGISGVPGLRHVLVEDPALAVLLADASGRIGRGPGVALLPGGVLRLGSQPGATARRALLQDVADLPTALAAWDVGEVFAAVEYQLDLDLAAPAPADLAPVQLGGEVQASTLAKDMAGVSMVVVAGPGVVRHDAVARAARGRGAPRSRRGQHMGREGRVPLGQSVPSRYGRVATRDAELAGLTSAELVIATGLDSAEMPVESWANGPVLDVDPRALEALTYQWDVSSREPGRSASVRTVVSRAPTAVRQCDRAALTGARRGRSGCHPS